MKRSLVSIAVVAVLCGLNITTVRAEVVDKVVAVVNGKAITMSELDRAWKMTSMERGQLSSGQGDSAKITREQILDVLINNILVDEAAKKSDVTVNADEVDKAIQGVSQRNGLSVDQLKAELAKEGTTWENYRKEAESQLKRNKFISREVSSKVNITNSDMQQYYKDNMNEFAGGSTAHIAQITLPFSEQMTKQDAENLIVEARKIAAQANKGNFASLAKTYSKGPNADKGGDLGVVDLKTIHPEIAKTIDQLKVGQISPPVMSPVGIHIIYLVDRGIATPKDFSRHQDDIQNRMFGQKFQESMDSFLLQLKQKAFITVNR